MPQKQIKQHQMSQKRERPSDLDKEQKIHDNPTKHRSLDSSISYEQPLEQGGSVQASAQPGPSAADKVIKNLSKTAGQQKLSSIFASVSTASKQKSSANTDNANSTTQSSQTNKFSNGVGIFTNMPISFFSQSAAFNQQKGGKSLFPASSSGNKEQSIVGTTQSLFTNINKSSLEGEQQENGDSQDSQQLQLQQIHEVDKTKSKGHYTYKQQGKILLTEQCQKIKKENGQIIQDAEILIHQNEDKSIQRVIVRLTATKKILLTGLILKGFSDVRQMGQKQENVMISVLVCGDSSRQRQVLKMQFKSAESGVKFREQFRKLAR